MMDTIILFAPDTSRNRDTYSNLSGTAASLISELVISNKNLVKALKENTRLERVLDQFQQHTGATGGDRETGRGGTSQQKRGYH